MRILFLLVFTTYSTFVIAQAKDTSSYSTFNYKMYDATFIGVNYGYNFGDKETGTSHLLGIDFAKGRYGGRHPFNAEWSAGVDIAFTDQITLAPYLESGASIGGIFFIAPGISYQTNFKENALVFRPVFALGNNKLQVGIKGYINITNVDFHPMNQGMVYIKYRFTLNRKEKIFQS